MDGADARIYVGQMQVLHNNSDWHVNNSMWILDHNTGTLHDCTYLTFGTGTAWAEVGYQSEGGNPTGWSQFFYWVDCRKDAAYYEEAIGPVTSSDRYQTNYFEIIRDGVALPYWHIQINAPSQSFSRTSAINDMYPTQIQIGGEATSDHGRYAANAYFSNNRWIWVRSNGTFFNYQISSYDDGTADTGVDYKILRWQTYWSPTPESSSTGGRWCTYFPS